MFYGTCFFHFIAKGGRTRVPDYVKVDDDKLMKKVAKKLEKQQVPQRTVVQRKVAIFSHLHQYEREVSLTQEIGYVPIIPITAK